mmetsp:Transcript_125288/g.350832  ORF Transcript_125288/g.350832 Transcript_125288/m.350832 type:complete len:273 (-) Transcript_125288:8-826(-)
MPGIGFMATVFTKRCSARSRPSKTCAACRSKGPSPTLLTCTASARMDSTSACRGSAAARTTSSFRRDTSSEAGALPSLARGLCAESRAKFGGESSKSNVATFGRNSRDERRTHSRFALVSSNTWLPCSSKAMVSTCKTRSSRRPKESRSLSGPSADSAEVGNRVSSQSKINAETHLERSNGSRAVLFETDAAVRPAVSCRTSPAPLRSGAQRPSAPPGPGPSAAPTRTAGRHIWPPRVCAIGRASRTARQEAPGHRKPLDRGKQSKPKQRIA